MESNFANSCNWRSNIENNFIMQDPINSAIHRLLQALKGHEGRGKCFDLPSLVIATQCS